MSWSMWYVRDDRGDLILAPPEHHDEEKAKRIYSEALTTIRNVSLISLDTQVPIGAITYPQHFNGSTLTTLRDTAMGLEPSLFRAWQFKKFLSCARLAYGMDSCLGFGLNNTSCNMKDDINEALFINYDE